MTKSVLRQVLPVPDRAARAPVTYDAKDPDTAFPPIESVLPPEGRIHRVQIDLGKDAEDNDHFITPEERMRIATTRQ